MTITNREIAYNGHFKIIKYTVSDGENSEVYECFERGDAVAAVVWNTEKEKFLFTKQFRIGSKSDLLEIVAGTMDVEGETPDDAIKREMDEELGYVVDKITPITSVYVSPGGTSEKTHIFYIEVSNKVSDGGGVGHEKIETVE